MNCPQGTSFTPLSKGAECDRHGVVQRWAKKSPASTAWDPSA